MDRTENTSTQEEEHAPVHLEDLSGPTLKIVGAVLEVQNLCLPLLAVDLTEDVSVGSSIPHVPGGHRHLVVDHW